MDHVGQLYGALSRDRPPPSAVSELVEERRSEMMAATLAPTASRGLRVSVPPGEVLRASLFPPETYIVVCGACAARGIITELAPASQVMLRWFRQKGTGRVLLTLSAFEECTPLLASPLAFRPLTGGVGTLHCPCSTCLNEIGEVVELKSGTTPKLARARIGFMPAVETDVSNIICASAWLSLCEQHGAVMTTESACTRVEEVPTTAEARARSVRARRSTRIHSGSYKVTARCTPHTRAPWDIAASLASMRLLVAAPDASTTFRYVWGAPIAKPDAPVSTTIVPPRLSSPAAMVALAAHDWARACGRDGTRAGAWLRETRGHGFR